MKMKWSSSSSSLSSAGDRRSSTFYTEPDTISNTDEMTSNAFTSLDSTILVPTIKSATLPTNPEKYLEFTKNTTKMAINSGTNINNYKLKNITNKINNRQNKQNNNNNSGNVNKNNNKTSGDDQLSNILNNLMYVEFRLKNDQKVIRELLYEKDAIINRQWREILCIKAKYQDEDIENIQIGEISQYCPKCLRNYYGVDAIKSAAPPQTIDDFGYRERKISPSQSVEFASSSEEPEFTHQQHSKPNSFAGLRRNRKYISKKTTGTFTDYLKRRHHSYSPSPVNTPSISNSDDQIEVKSILSQTTNVDSSYSQRINSLHGIKIVSPVMTRSSGSSATYEMIESGERKQNNKFIYDFEEEKNDSKGGFEVTDDWYASASDVEDSDNGMIKPYGYNAVNPVLECVNQILLQQSMDGIIDNGTASPSPPPTKPPSGGEQLPTELTNKPPALPKTLPPTPHNSSQQKHQTLPRTKRVHFSTQNSMVQVPRNKTTPPPPPPPPPPSSSTQSHNSNSSEKSMKNSSYDIQSIYSNEYEPIGGGSENTSVSSNYYIDMDSTVSMSKANSITNTECNRNLIDGPMSKVKLNPPDLPPKPPNLIKFKKLTKFNLNLNQNLVNTNAGSDSNAAAAINPNNSGGNSNVNGSVSEPDYCSISEIHEIIVNNSQTTGGGSSSTSSSKVNGLQYIQTVEAEVHKACDEYSISNNDDDSISVKSIIKLDEYNTNLLSTTNCGGHEQIQIQQTNDSNNGHHQDREDDDSDDLNDIPKLPNVAEIITPTKKEAARNMNNILNNNNCSNFMSINQDNYITKSIGDLKFTNGNSTKLNGIINSATNKKLNSILLKSPASNHHTTNLSNKMNHQHPVIHDNNTISIIPTDKIPLIQAEFDWYNLDAEYGKSVQSGGQNAIPDVLTNNSGSNQNHGAPQNSDLSFLKLFDNCNIEPANNHVEYNLDDIEFNNNSTNSATHSSASSTHSSSDSSNSGRINQPDIIKKIQELENISGPTANLLKFKSNYERFLNETTAMGGHNGGMTGKPIILPRRKRVYYSGPFV